MGNCTLPNVWWEGRASAKTPPPSGARRSVSLHGVRGGAKKASGKVLRFKGAGKLVVLVVLVITKFQVAAFGKDGHDPATCVPTAA
ncbi:hypothetical protein ABZX75_05030 [Streptomyces sp. NPDC003038]|uniref:hypothetical protein n=1 Tax=unclassified Streptomyces TaxID=2593676 RepID=UPI0033A51260